MKFNLPEAILLDLDDTILAFDALKDECWKKVGLEYEAEIEAVSVSELLSAIYEQSDWFWSDGERHRIWRQNLPKARRLIVSMAFEKLGIRGSELSDRMADRFTEVREMAIKPLPGALETVRAFRNLGIRLALVTNGSSESQRKKIERFGLEPLFEDIFIEGEQGFGKPDERIYVKALNSLSVEPDKTWMIGDNISWDVIAPQKLGISGIWINRNGDSIGENDEKPFLSVSSLSEIMDYVQ